MKYLLRKNVPDAKAGTILTPSYNEFEEDGYGYMDIQNQPMWYPDYSVHNNPEWFLKLKRFKAKEKERIYSICNTGEIISTICVNNADGYDSILYSRGNYFPDQIMAAYVRDKYPITKYNEFWEDFENGKVCPY